MKNIKAWEGIEKKKLNFDINAVYKYDCYVETFQALVKQPYHAAAEEYLLDALERELPDHGEENFLLSIDIDSEKLKLGNSDIRFLFLVEYRSGECSIMYIHMICP